MSVKPQGDLATDLQQPLAYLDAAFLTCAVCELANSLESEVKFIWQGSRSASQICYVLARYVCIVSFVIFLLGDAHAVAHHLRVLDEGFLSKGGLADWLLNINLAFVEIIFTLRTWALWDQSRRMAICLSVLVLLVWSAALVNVAYLETFGGSRASYYFIPFAVFYLTIMVLVMVKAFRARHYLNTSFIWLVHAQGVTYYTLLFALSLAAVSLLLAGSVTFVIVARTIQFLSTQMACRMTLTLLAQSNRPAIGPNTSGLVLSDVDTAVPLTTLDFRHSRGTNHTTVNVAPW